MCSKYLRRRLMEALERLGVGRFSQDIPSLELGPAKIPRIIFFPFISFYFLTNYTNKYPNPTRT